MSSTISPTNPYLRDNCVRNFPEAYAAGRASRLAGEPGTPEAYDLLSGEKKAYMFGRNEATTMTYKDWNAMHADYKTGDPRKGTAKILTMVPGVGTCLVPVSVMG